jgi:hypothetical protein
MRAFATQVEVLRRLRSGGQQFVRVEHVHVNDGGTGRHWKCEKGARISGAARVVPQDDFLEVLPWSKCRIANEPRRFFIVLCQLVPRIANCCVKRCHITYAAAPMSMSVIRPFRTKLTQCATSEMCPNGKITARHDDVQMHIRTTWELRHPRVAHQRGLS